VEHRHAVPVAGDRLAIDQARAHPERAGGIGNERVTVRPVVPVAGQQPDTSGVALDHHAKAVVLDFMNPAGAGRRSLGGVWETGANETGRRPAGTQQHRGKPDSWPWQGSRFQILRRTTIRAMSRLRAGAPSERHMAAEQYVIASQSVLADPQTRLSLSPIRPVERRRFRRARRWRCRRPHHENSRRASWLAVDVDAHFRASRGPYADARLRGDS